LDTRVALVTKFRSALSPGGRQVMVTVTTAPLTAEGDKIKLQFKPYEIKTVKVRF
jgi:copper(I)-binding protein